MKRIRYLTIGIQKNHNFDDLILSEYENNIFRLKSDEGNYPFIVINGKWYFYVDAFETKSDIKHFNYNIEEH